MTNEERQQIADICRAHDEFMIEAREWLRKSPVSESDDVGLIYKDHDKSAPQPAPAPEPVPSDDEPTLEYAIKQFCGAVDRRFERLEHAHVELRGKVDALLTLFGQRAGDGTARGLDHRASVIDLPGDFIRKVRDVE
jgi:hypothetical protein